jgi:septum formation protein
MRAAASVISSLSPAALISFGNARINASILDNPCFRFAIAQIRSRIANQFAVEWPSVMELEQQRQASDAESHGDRPFTERLVLASTSPRRAEILRAVGWPFEKCAVDIDEARLPGEEPIAYVERLALEKANAATAQHLSRLILGADTVVVVAGELLGKPTDEDDARRMLRLLSGRWHEVITGIALVRTGRSDDGAGNRRVAHELTKVRFADMTADEIDWYVASGEPFDKAGAYAIQGKAARFIAEIQGDYLNIVGLPVRLIYELSQNRLR